MTAAPRRIAVGALASAALAVSLAATAQETLQGSAQEGTQEAAQEAAQGAAQETVEAAPAVPAPLEVYDAETPLVAVGDTVVTLGALIRERRLLSDALQALPDETLYDALLDELTRREVLAAAAERAALDRRPDVARALAEARRLILADAFVEHRVLAEMPNAVVRQRYEAEVAELAGENEARLRHILVATESAARAAQAELDAGADFAAVALRLSIGPSAADGGDLGYVREGAMPPEFDAAAAALTPGAHSAPVETVLGWHLIKLEDRRAIAVPPFEDRMSDLSRAIAEDVSADLVRGLFAPDPAPPAAGDPTASYTRALVESVAPTLRVDRPDRAPPPSAIREDGLVADR